jgi:hypothetical protein
MPNQDQDTSHWRVLFQKIIHPTKERQRIAVALGVNNVTLMRWAKGTSHPQQSSLARLVKVVHPQYRQDLLKALKIAYPNLEEQHAETSSETVPSSFFRQVLQDRATVIEALRSWQTTATILDQAIIMLDPHNLGMAITPVLCMPPVDGRIRSLREQGGRGTYPWSADQEHMSIFLGMNCLAGYVVQSGRQASVRDVDKEKYIPVFAYPENWEKSAAACPIWLEGKIAGCLLAASYEIEHFTQARMDLLTHFANVFSLALNADNFYDPHLIHLRYIPRPKHQNERLQTFRQRSNRLMAQSMHNGHPMSTSEAEKRIWRAIEDELLETGANLKDDE